MTKMPDDRCINRISMEEAGGKIRRQTPNEIVSSNKKRSKQGGSQAQEDVLDRRHGREK